MADLTNAQVYKLLIDSRNLVRKAMHDNLTACVRMDRALNQLRRNDPSVFVAPPEEQEYDHGRAEAARDHAGTHSPESTA